MSRPYQFAEEKSTRSPLDRPQQNLYPAGQPPSFKTNVNRAKTKRWVEAKAVSYGGDDWGDYDEYDEYGADEPPPAPPSNPSVPTGLRQKGQSAAEAGRSFTDPQPPRQPSIPRKNSFDAGDERRAFSSAAPQGFSTTSPIDASAAGRNGGFGEAAPLQNQQYAARTVAQPQPINTQVPPGSRQPSASQSEISDTPQHRRDFSPSALPPPLHTRASPAPGSAPASPAGARFPPRKSSISNPSPSEALGPQFPANVTTSASAQSLRGRTPSNPTKPLPFIRPADIYKRVEEERVKERQSLDSGRPSLDSLSSRPTEEPTAGRGLRERGSAESLGKTGRRPSMERGGEAGESGRSLQPLEPVVERKSEYLPDFNLASQATMGGDPSLRSMVDQAFTRNDDNSIPPTPVSKQDTYSQSGDGVSRSNTESSYGISPIMSRVPSSATSALKAKNVGGAETSTPAIAEETSETSTPTSRPPSGAMLGGGYKVNRKPSPAHSRNVSSGSLVGTPPHQTGLHTPSPAESPARSPAIEAQKAIPEPEAAVLSTLNPLPLGNPNGNENSVLPNYATREADIATVAKRNPENTDLALGEAANESQRAFLESHQGVTSDLERAPRSRSESPSKGRVQELAGKFDGISDSRRGSTHSSIASWERSQEDLPITVSAIKSKPNTRDSSPVKAPLSLRPTADREPSFRPKLPGRWESYATTVPTPLEEPSKDRQLGGTFAQSAADVEQKNDRNEEVDLTPTTQRRSASPHKSDALAALQAAGNAMGEAIKASVGLGTSDAETGNTTSKAPPGNVFLRPLQLDRTVSSAESSNPPSPPPKDGSFEDLTPGSHEMTPTRPSMLPQLSTDPSAHDLESDKLRKEIVRSLSPLKQSDSSLQPGAPSLNNRESSILPSEYESYWADGNPDKDVARQSVVQPSHELGAVLAPSAGQSTPEPRPGLLDNRFSWERSAEAGPQISNAPTMPTSQADTVASPSTARADVESPHEESYAGVPEPYFGPGHATSGAQIVPQIAEPEAKPESKSLLGQAEVNKKAESPVHYEANELTSPVSPNRPSSSEGLHVVNSAVDPEAVDMPPRLAEEVAEEKEAQQKSAEAQQAPKPTSHEAPLGPRPPTAKSPQPISPSGKPLGFREILAIRSAPDRIATYNRTRDYWATTDHSLHEWMTKTLAANPEHASLSSLTSRPTMATPASGSLRHRPTASISLFGKSTSSSAPQPATPYYEQYNAAASQLPLGVPPTTPGGTPSQQTPSTGGAGTRITSHQLEKKGKDLLHTAGIFGGKATTGAKGLFAKGKSRFKSSGSDKVDH
ncbi:uncharacterized protein BDZ99DRAFT_511281 [Mytilinidion resinicola]|uniref:Uncharacterized protein n=1 Tax=Mytilinidion resinicola TaxID=574789 RepID=A0A6A6Y8T1_9PEZI|nr:uncharacterized protein BDZ99DRAFT_511281 [Mytilinidion resinicola]KAF2805246.1 hypothetical protein BDZ99DRAFT_511281 [Mytilinidion resinicola]